MTSDSPFISYAQNGEDVVLSRVFGRIDVGTYIEVGANHPTVDSVSRSFYDRGWAGLEFEPSASHAQLFRKQRPRDVVVEAAVTDSADPTALFHQIGDTGLSTLVDSISAEHAKAGFDVIDVEVPTIRLDSGIEKYGFADRDIHFLLIDTEGAELEVLRSMDLRKYRPWVVVVEATAPRTTTQTHMAWEPLVLEAGYEFCLFDGLSRFYVAQEHSAELASGLSYPAGAFDSYVSPSERAILAERDALRGELECLVRELAHESELRRRTEAELYATKGTLSWRVTGPVRWLGRRLRRPSSRP